MIFNNIYHNYYRSKNVYDKYIYKTQNGQCDCIRYYYNIHIYTILQYTLLYADYRCGDFIHRTNLQPSQCGAQFRNTIIILL